MNKPIAALYVETCGPYYGLDGVDPWDASRDARNYEGPHPVVAHPPCKRWGRYWHGGPSVKVRKLLGNDGGMFAHALWAVRTFGGVLEHPEASHAWHYYGLSKPPKSGGWVRADHYGGWTCCVEQGHYGHRARKATWLYAKGPRVMLPELTWGPSQGDRLDAGYHSAQERAEAKARGETTKRDTGRLTATERLHTPTEFRDLLIDMARGLLV